MSKADVLTALKKQLSIAEAEDKKAAAKHHAEEWAALKKFKAKLTAALKWDYKTAKKSPYGGIRLESPSCPRLEAKRFRFLIEQVQRDQRKSDYTFGETHDIAHALAWLPAHKRLKDTVCD